MVADADVLNGYDANKEVALEKQAEMEEIMKRCHRPMKVWYKENKDLANEFGRFPIFWQDLKKWEHWNTVYKKYLAATQEEGVKENGVNGSSDVGGGSGTSSSSAAAPESGSTEGAATAGKRKSRWGDAPAVKKGRKSRWSDEKTELNPTLGAALASGALTPEQLETVSLRLRLEEVNRKLATVVEDAKRIAEDPARSPSPPPRYDSNGARTNTREVRMRNKFLEQRNGVMVRRGL